MDENPTTHPGVAEEVYHRLGRKTFIMFLMERISAPVVFLVISAALFVVGASWNQLIPANMAKYGVQPYVFLAAWATLGIAVLVALIVLLAAWLVYANFKFFLGEDSLKIKRGILDKEEVAIPYRQIQDVDIERDLSYRMFGVSRLVILTAGNEEEKKPDEDESEGIFPAIDKDLAEWLQSELLRRANVQKVTETKAGPIGLRFGHPDEGRGPRFYLLLWNRTNKTHRSYKSYKTYQIHFGSVGGKDFFNAL
jgi:uncharacterized membrane protein YdbT with pleckstrin-like domain